MGQQRVSLVAGALVIAAGKFGDLFGPGAMLQLVLVLFHAEIAAQGNRLILAGVTDKHMAVLETTGTLAEIGRSDIIPAQPAIFGALDAAVREGDAWIAGRKGVGSDEPQDKHHREADER